MTLTDPRLHDPEAELERLYVQQQFPSASRVLGLHRLGTVMSTGQQRGRPVVYVAWDYGTKTGACPDTVIPASLVPLRDVSWA